MTSLPDLKIFDANSAGQLIADEKGRPDSYKTGNCRNFRTNAKDNECIPGFLPEGSY